MDETTQELLIFLGFIAVFVVPWVFARRCPQCKRYNAFRKTGEQRTEKVFETIHQYDEWLCERCGHREWKKLESKYFSGR